MVRSCLFPHRHGSPTNVGEDISNVQCEIFVHPGYSALHDWLSHLRRGTEQYLIHHRQGYRRSRVWRYIFWKYNNHGTFGSTTPAPFIRRRSWLDLRSTVSCQSFANRDRRFCRSNSWWGVYRSTHLAMVFLYQLATRCNHHCRNCHVVSNLTTADQ